MSAIRKIRLLLLVLLLVFGSAACTKQQESKGYNSNILSSELLVTKETVYNTKVLKKRML
jgi:uncharacterized lipoprotein YehR (DUF1307 family)